MKVYLYVKLKKEKNFFSFSSSSRVQQPSQDSLFPLLVQLLPTMAVAAVEHPLSIVARSNLPLSPFIV